MLTSSVSCIFVSLGVCLDMQCVGVDNCTENAKSMIIRALISIY